MVSNFFLVKKRQHHAYAMKKVRTVARGENKAIFETWNYGKQLHYRQKIWNNFHFTDFFVFCGVSRVYFYLIYIPTSRYYFWGVYSHSIAKLIAKVQKQLFWAFFFIRRCLVFWLSHWQIAAISVRVFIRDIMHNIIVYFPPRLVRSAGD